VQAAASHPPQTEEARWEEVRLEVRLEVGRAGQALAVRPAQVVAASRPPQTEEARWGEAHPGARPEVRREARRSSGNRRNRLASGVLGEEALLGARRLQGHRNKSSAAPSLGATLQLEVHLEVHPGARPEVRRAGQALAARLAQVVAASRPLQIEEARWGEVHPGARPEVRRAGQALAVRPEARLEAWQAGLVAAQVALEVRPEAYLEARRAGQVGVLVALEVRLEAWRTDQAGTPAASASVIRRKRLDEELRLEGQ